MLVYRDTATTVSRGALLAGIADALARPELDRSAVIRAGSLECALADAGLPEAARAATLTDRIAEAWLGKHAARQQALALLPELSAPDTLRVTRPEGYAFYALDPYAYAALARDYASARRAFCVVIGIRSIGTSLSAVVRAELTRAGIPNVRHTVRPTGHPWNRELRWSPIDEQVLARVPDGAEYVIVDEGPGLSGSTFLAVAEALVARGVSHHRIRFFCSHTPDPQRLLASDGARRWARFQAHSPCAWRAPRLGVDVSGGVWRSVVYGADTAWPASWTAHERVKYLSADRRRLVKFEGFGPYGEDALARAEILANAGWSPPVWRAEPGFLAYAWLPGGPARRERDRSTAAATIGRYLAFRATALSAPTAEVDALEAMARLNVQEAIGVDLEPDYRLEIERPVYPDGQLMPHEWIRTPTGMLKTDAVDHGDDHLFPGATDVAWDLAGAMTEWGFDVDESNVLLEEYRRHSGDDARRRISAYLVAYAAFRVALCVLAAHTGDDAEKARWARERRRYESRLRATLERSRVRMA